MFGFNFGNININGRSLSQNAEHKTKNSGRKICFLTALMFVNNSLFSQVITENNKAYLFPKVIKQLNYHYNEGYTENTDTLIQFSYYVLENEMNLFPLKKVGQMIEYFENGQIKNIGFWNSQNDTFSLDSNKIIVFINPSTDIWLQQSYSKIILNDSNFKGNTFKFSEINNWNISFDNKGQLTQMVLNNIKVSYFDAYLRYELFRNNQFLKTWTIFK